MNTFFHLRNPLYVFVAFTLMLAGCQDREVLINGEVEIYAPNDLESEVMLAVEALAGDIEMVLGGKPAIIREMDKLKAQTVIYIANGQLPDDLKHTAINLNGREAHAVYSVQSAERDFLVAYGEDVLGTIYAIYTISEEVLGIPPMHAWAGWQPRQKDAIELEPDDYWLFEEPAVRWRVWFPNDHDLLTPWQQGNDDRYGLMFESLLRCKYNALEGWHSVDRPEDYKPYCTGKLYENAARYGVAVTGHHAMPFSSYNIDWDRFWPLNYQKEAPPLSTDDVEALKTYWKYHIETSMKNQLRPIWSIGFRGIGDVPFWHNYENPPIEDAARAKIISDMLDVQIDLLKQTTGVEAPEMRWTMYHENSHYVAEGLIIPPKEENLIWVFVNDRRDHFPPDAIRNIAIPEDQKYGYYYHFQFTSTGAHYAQAEGVDKMLANLDYVREIAGKNPSLVVFNVGSVREFITEIAIGGKVLWDLEHADADRLLLDYFGDWVGSEYANEVKAIYEAFINTYWEQKGNDLPGIPRQYIFQEQRYKGAIQSLLGSLKKGEKDLNPFGIRYNDSTYYNIDTDYLGAPNQLTGVINGTAQSIQQLEQVVSDADKLYEMLNTGKSFFNIQIRLQAKYMLGLNKSLNLLAKAMIAKEAEQDEIIKQAQREFLKAKSTYLEGNNGIFDTWYYFAFPDGRERYATYEAQDRVYRRPWLLDVEDQFEGVMK